jgi:hypothetical protein
MGSPRLTRLALGFSLLPAHGGCLATFLRRREDSRAGNEIDGGLPKQCHISLLSCWLAEDLAITSSPISVSQSVSSQSRSSQSLSRMEPGSEKKAASATARTLRGQVEVAEPSELRVNQRGNVAVVSGARSRVGHCQGQALRVSGSAEGCVAGFRRCLQTVP